MQERDNESRELRERLSEHEVDADRLREDLETLVARVEDDAAEKAQEIDAANAEIQRLSDRIFELEDEKEDADKWISDAKADLEELSALVTALKSVSLLLFLIPMLFSRS